MDNLVDIKFKQTSNIIMITFWSQFASYAFYSIFILFLTRPLLKQGLGYSQADAYAFIGISGATGYLMPMLGGYMADSLLGVRRSILIGSSMLALTYLLVMLSGLSITQHGDTFFIAAYALLPASNSLLMGTATSMVSNIYKEDAVKAKAAMTYYYLSINIGALLSTIIAPELFESRYGPLSVLTIAFIGKAIAALNFAYRYKLYDNVIWGKDKSKLKASTRYQLFVYVLSIYVFTLFAYAHVKIANILVTIGCACGIGWFFFRTCRLENLARSKQLVAFVLIIESIVFFVIYNQMSTTLILLAQNNSDKHFLGLTISPAQYQMLNPALIILLGIFLPRFYRAFPRFSIPYQFACGTLLAGLALLVMYFAGSLSHDGFINGNYIAFSYTLISLGELFVSAIGLSMIGLYCEQNELAFAMGIWSLGGSLASTISGLIARFVSIPDNLKSPLASLAIYKNYYLQLGLITCLLGLLMLILGKSMQNALNKRGVVLH